MPKKGEFKLSEEQRAEMVARYQAGEGQHQLAQAFGVSWRRVRQLICDAGLLRTREQTIRVRAQHQLAGISPARLRELYWGPDRLSIETIAEMFGVHWGIVYRRLQEFQIPRRSKAEQIAAEYAAGRRVPAHQDPDKLRRRPKPQIPFCEMQERARGLQAPAIRAKRAEACKRRLSLPCGWCGKPVERTPFEAARWRVSCCDPLHAGRFRMHVIHHGSDAPRPLIVERVVTTATARGGRWDYDRLARHASQFGAREPEVWAALERLSVQ